MELCVCGLSLRVLRSCSIACQLSRTLPAWLLLRRAHTRNTASHTHPHPHRQPLPPAWRGAQLLQLRLSCPVPRPRAEPGRALIMGAPPAPPSRFRSQRAPACSRYEHEPSSTAAATARSGVLAAAPAGRVPSSLSNRACVAPPARSDGQHGVHATTATAGSHGHEHAASAGVCARGAR